MIAASAIVSPKARLAADVRVGPFCIIHDDVEIGAGSVIEAYCEIGYPTPLAQGRPLQIGANALIRSHSVFYQGSRFGDGLLTGHRVTVRENIEAGLNLQIGTLSDLQGDATFGDYVRLHSNVHIGKHSTVGSFVWIFPYVVLTNDPHPPSEVRAGCVVGDYAVVATMSVLLPGASVGEHALVAAHSMVGKDVAPHTVVGGSPAKFLCNTRDIKRKDGSGAPAYPWTSHFTRGYPPDVVAQWGGP